MDLGDVIRGGSSGGDKGRGFRRAHGVLFATAGLKTGGLGRDARGRFTTFQNELYQVNLGLAIQLQDMMAERLEATRVPSRRGVASGRLEKAILDRRNRVVNNGGFGVGRIEWLDKSEAKYWRAIEVGTSQFVGNVIPTGVWGGSLTGQMGGTSPYGPYPIAGPPFTLSGANRSGRVRPMGRTYMYRVLAASGMAKRQAYLMSRNKHQAVIQRPIEAHHYMKGAWRDFRPAARGREAIQRALRASGIGGG